MIPYTLHLIRAVLGTSIGLWSADLHAIVLSLLAGAWMWPLVALLFRRMPNRPPDIEWVMLWRCPRCSTFNRRSFFNCTHCDYSLKVGGAGRWVHALYEWMQSRGRLGLKIYVFCGWALFYGVTGLLFYGLRLYSFKQAPMLELLASAAMALLLLSLLYFHLALRPRSKPLIGAALHLVTGTLVAVLAGFVVLTWVEAGIPPHSSLASIRALDRTRIEMLQPGGARTEIHGIPVGAKLEFDLQYGVVMWKAMGIRHAYVTHISGHPVRPAWVLWVGELADLPVIRQAPYLPRLSSFQQKFQIPPNSSVAVYDDPLKNVLSLRR